MKKLATLFSLLILIAVAAIPAYANAASDEVSTYAYTAEESFIFEDGVITGYTGTDTALMIPSTINGEPVTTIGVYAFQDCTEIETVVIPKSVTEIKYGAFSCCSNLENIYLPDSIKYFGAKVFEGTSFYMNEDNWVDYYLYLDNYLICVRPFIAGAHTVKSGTTLIADEAFKGCIVMQELTIPEGVKYIGNYAFQDCPMLTDVSIPDSIESIGDNAFVNTALYSDNWDGLVLYIDDCLVGVDTSITGSYTIKSGTRVISSAAFAGCLSLIGITIPDGIKHIDKETFSNCISLNSITLNDDITSIGESAFANCIELPDMVLPASVKYIGKDAFTTASSGADIYFPGDADDLDIVGSVPNLHVNSTGTQMKITPDFDEYSWAFYFERMNVSDSCNTYIAIYNEDGSLMNCVKGPSNSLDGVAFGREGTPTNIKVFAWNEMEPISVYSTFEAN